MKVITLQNCGTICVASEAIEGAVDIHRSVPNRLKKSLPYPFIASRHIFHTCGLRLTPRARLPPKPMLAKRRLNSVPCDRSFESQSRHMSVPHCHHSVLLTQPTSPHFGGQGSTTLQTEISTSLSRGQSRRKTLPCLNHQSESSSGIPTFLSPKIINPSPKKQAFQPICF